MGCRSGSIISPPRRTAGRLPASRETAAPRPCPATERVHLAIFVDDVHLAPQNRSQVFARLKEYLESSLQADRPGGGRADFRPADDRTAFHRRRRAARRPSTAWPAPRRRALQQDANYQRIVTEIMSTATPSDEQLARQREDPRADQDRWQGDRSDLGRHPGPRVSSPSASARLRVLGTIKALETAVGSLAGLPGRKALIYLADGLPVRAAASLAEIWRDKYENWAVQNGSRALLAELSRVASIVDRGGERAAQDGGGGLGGPGGDLLCAFAQFPK